ncbi:hypothetical protein ACQKKK_21705 [Peribacillus sp. NPDC006672]|uniref:SunI/YnzG family protein n=1 Tax=Peribacillus sp. NPDC006672 TaxID=3390606 RepID=UPI003D0910E0
MIGIRIEKINENLIIKWQFTKVTIPISDIMAITNDDTYGGEGKSAIRIGSPYPATDRILIKTTEETYILFTSNAVSLKKRLTSYINDSTKTSNI